MGRRKQKVPRPSPGEFEILSMLWEQGPLTLSEAHQSFGNFGREVGYTTVQTRLNRLVEKGAVRRSRQRPAKYEAAVAREDVGARHIDILLDKMSDVRIVPLVAHLISAGSLSQEEIRQLKGLIAQAEATARESLDREEDRP